MRSEYFTFECDFYAKRKHLVYIFIWHRFGVIPTTTARVTASGSQRLYFGKNGKSPYIMAKIKKIQHFSFFYENV